MISTAITRLEFDTEDVDEKAATARKMQTATILVYVSECLRRRRFPATVGAIHRDLEDEFGLTPCLRTVRRYLQLLEVLGVAECFPPDGDFCTTWSWNKGLGLLAILDREGAAT